MLATTNVTLEKDLHKRVIFTYKCNLAKAWINPRHYLKPMQTNFHASDRYRTKRACAQIENH